MKTTPSRIVVLVACAVPVVCWGAAPRPNILLITADTLRADHLSSYGYAWRTSPHIDQLAREGTRFDRAYTTIPLTGPAHFSLLTSLYPQEHGVRRNGVAIENSRRLTALPQMLRKKGYRTAAFVSAWPLTGRLTHLNKWFDHFDEDLNRSYQLFNSSRWAEDVTPRAIAWLKQHMGKGKPVFLWVHYFDPHSPYDFRADFAKLQPAGPPPKRIDDEETRERVRNYDTEIAYMDWHVGKLLGAVDDLGQRNTTLVVLTADHGESLGEHDYVGHGRALYENIVRVPLIFRMPGKVRAGQVIPTPVSILDIAPTVTDLTLSKPPAKLRFSGRKLTRTLTAGELPPDAPVYCATFPGKKGFMPGWLSRLWVTDEPLPSLFGFVEGRRKLIWSPGDEEVRMYDLAHDPAELKPERIADSAGSYQTRTAQLRTWFKSTESRAGRESASEKDLEVLKTLGYAQ